MKQYYTKDVRHHSGFGRVIRVYYSLHMTINLHIFLNNNPGHRNHQLKSTSFIFQTFLLNTQSPIQQTMLGLPYFLTAIAILSRNIVEGKAVYFVTRTFTNLVLDVNFTYPEPTFARTGLNFYSLPLGEVGRRELYKDPCDLIEGERFDTYDQFPYRPGGVSAMGDATLVVGNDNTTVVICKRIYSLLLTPSGNTEEGYAGENEVYNITEEVGTYWREIFSRDETCEGYCLSDNYVCKFSDDVDTCAGEFNDAHRFGDKWWQLENVDGDTAIGPNCNTEQACVDGSSGLSTFFGLCLAAMASIAVSLF